MVQPPAPPTNQGLRVADASIMPGIVRANTHLASVAIGENAARKILAERHQRVVSERGGMKEDVAVWLHGGGRAW